MPIPVAKILTKQLKCYSGTWHYVDSNNEDESKPHYNDVIEKIEQDS